MTGRGFVLYWLILQGTYLAIGVVNFWMLIGLRRLMRQHDHDKQGAA